MEKQYQTVIHEVTPLSGKDCFYIADRHKTAFTYPIHSHADFELNFTLNAAGVRRIVGDSIEVIGDYDLVLITSENLEHVWEHHECTSQNIREITIQFSSELFFGNFLQKNQFSSIRYMLEIAQKGLAFPVETIMRVFYLLDNMASGQQGFYAVIKFLEILYQLSLNVKDARILSSSSFAKVELRTDQKRIGKIQEYINENYRESIKLDQLADMIGMTSVSFCRFFKLHTGKSPIDYIIDTRLGYASRLLADSSKTVAEICFECGFNNISNFNRIFRKNKHCTPKEFRENYKKKMVVI
ncbi:MAG: AraC family transcriptional regulator [Prevotella sp.]|jgi:AraC-like DNA-binding protein|nr:AraC family transcriptional regulator [Prevotella sp.]